MKFYSLNYLWLLVPWVFLPAIWIFLEKTASEKFSVFISKLVFSRLVEGFSLERRKLKFALVWLSFGFLILAAARPQYGLREELLKSQGLDVVFLLDVSNSMTTEDVVPSRLKKAKHILRGFLERFSGDRAGIVAFAGSSFPAVPLTTDYDYVKQILETLDEGSIQHQGTDFESALQTALGLLERGSIDDGSQSGQQSGSKVIVVLSDGEDHEGNEAALAPQLKDAGIRVFTIGIGSLKGGPMPIRDEKGVLQGYKKDSAGNMILSKLESAALEAIAHKTGGRYYPASNQETEIEETMAAFEGLNRAEGGVRRVVVYGEFFQIPLAIALLFLSVFIFLAERVIPATLILALLSVVGHSAKAADPIGEFLENKKGMQSYSTDQLADSVNSFGKAQAARPDSKINNYNLGTALLKSGSAQQAISELKEATKSEDFRVSGQASFNLAKAYKKQNENEKAVQALQKGLNHLKEKKSLTKEEQEMMDRFKITLQETEEEQQKKKKQEEDNGNKKDPEPKNDKDKKDGSSKPDPKPESQDQKKNEEKKFDIPQEKKKFKSEHLSEQDAKRLMQQLKEQDNKTQQKFRGKKEKDREQRSHKRNVKDW